MGRIIFIQKVISNDKKSCPTKLITHGDYKIIFMEMEDIFAFLEDILNLKWRTIGGHFENLWHIGGHMGGHFNAA